MKVTVENGMSGYGEIGPIHGGGISAYIGLIETRIKDLVIGNSCFDREKLLDRMIGRGTSAYAFGAKGAAVSAAAGVEMALWDLTGKLLDTPVWNLLGGKVHAKIPAYASGFFGIQGRALTAEECGEEAKGYVDQGFKGIKMKIGFGLDQDLQNLESVRSALGPDLGIMVDANQCFNYPELMRNIDEYKNFNLTFIEEPIRINDLYNMANLARYSGVPIAAGENYYTKYEFMEVLEKRAVNIIQPDLIHAGGISETKKIAAIAEAYDVPLCPHIHASVAVSSAIHLLASCNNTLAAEYITSGGSYGLRKELCGNCCMVEDGYIPAPEGPGLGIDVNEDVFEKYYPKWLR